MARGDSSANLSAIANQIVLSCGLGRILDVGCGEGKLVSALLARGIDAYGLDASAVVVDRANGRCPGRFLTGSVLALPYEQDAFDAVVSTGCLEHLAPHDVPVALREIYRVSRRQVFLQVATAKDQDNHWHLTVERRAWWERQCFEAGFRKHPSYYRLNHYEALNQEGWQIYVLLEKVPVGALARYPLATLEAERGLRMDMMRETGARSDAHIMRYQWACGYVRPGDRVLDAACGLGYGGRVVRHLTRSESVMGVDGSASAVDYAKEAFAVQDPGLRFREGVLPRALSGFEDGSFEAIVSFDTLERVEDPEAFLEECHRLLTPGGRLLVSVPNDWSSETGEDPNPHHLHVYDWNTLKRQLASRFILETAYAQTWERRPRSLNEVPLDVGTPPECEWWLMAAMKTPLGATQPYHERVFANIRASHHASITYDKDYLNPWLAHSMVTFGYRLKNAAPLVELAEAVMRNSPATSVDHATALCVCAYRLLEKDGAASEAIDDILEKIDAVVSAPPAGNMGVRWKVALLFVKARLQQRQGNLPAAIAAYDACASIDVVAFYAHLGAKPPEALYHAGKLSLSLGRVDQAKHYWSRGVAFGNVLLSCKPADILINPDHPNRFNHGDGVREYALAWDFIARCANGIYLLASDPSGRQVDFYTLDNSFLSEYQGVTQELIDCRKELVERTKLLESATRDLVERTKDLAEARATFAHRMRRTIKTIFKI